MYFVKSKFMITIFFIFVYVKTSCITNQARDLLGRSNVGTDRQTNQQTDQRTKNRGACSRLKRYFEIVS
jgi:hypothetical protein